MQTPAATANYYGPAKKNPLLTNKNVVIKNLSPNRMSSKVFVENAVHRDSPDREKFAQQFNQSEFEMSQQESHITPKLCKLEGEKSKTSMNKELKTNKSNT